MTTPDSGIGVLGVDNVLFTVGDLDAAVEFYATALGLPPAFRMDEPGIALFRLGEEPAGLLVRRGEIAAVRRVPPATVSDLCGACPVSSTG